jgi:hypothetical protein
MSKLGILATAICVCTALPLVVRAQEHTGHSESSAGDGIPVSAGQAAYAAIRQHLVEMDDATMRAVTTERNVPAGIEIDIDGAGPAGAAATRMATTHMRILEQGSEYRASSAAVPGGVRITITARDPRNAQVVDRIRGLGFAGIMTEGEHHARHHIALARGDTGRHGTH